MSLRLLSAVVALCTAAVLAQPTPGPVCNVSDAYDLSHGIADSVDCDVLVLQNSVALTATSFAATSLSLDNQNLTIQSNNAAPEVILDFGSYALNSRVSITGLATLTFHDITLQNYASTTVQNGTLNTFLPLFNVDSTAQLLISNVRFLVDAGRCTLDSNYATELATPRTSW